MNRGDSKYTSTLHCIFEDTRKFKMKTVQSALSSPLPPLRISKFREDVNLVLQKGKRKKRKSRYEPMICRLSDLVGY